MEEVPELVEDRLNLSVGQERRPAFFRGGEVSGDEAEVRPEGASVPGPPREEVVHPGPLAFFRTRKPIRIEGSQPDSVLVSDFVIANIRMPHLIILGF